MPRRCAPTCAPSCSPSLSWLFVYGHQPSELCSSTRMEITCALTSRVFNRGKPRLCEPPAPTAIPKASPCRSWETFQPALLHRGNFDCASRTSDPKRCATCDLGSINTVELSSPQSPNGEARRVQPQAVLLRTNLAPEADMCQAWRSVAVSVSAHSPLGSADPVSCAQPLICVYEGTLY